MLQSLGCIGRVEVVTLKASCCQAMAGESFFVTGLKPVGPSPILILYLASRHIPPRFGQRQSRLQCSQTEVHAMRKHLQVPDERTPTISTTLCLSGCLDLPKPRTRSLLTERLYTSRSLLSHVPHANSDDSFEVSRNCRSLRELAPFSTETTIDL
jgi:hypothetical protein